MQASRRIRREAQSWLAGVSLALDALSHPPNWNSDLVVTWTLEPDVKGSDQIQKIQKGPYKGRRTRTSQILYESVCIVKVYSLGVFCESL